ncbi:hypothetical protein PN36_20740 [Candidatus Thiomargarita nelsonii]|uniref:Uncharacterized protein n=1 Tax=Candidatus Thiomargarita nelsonii TaxID=1003181 RepID=A0A4E0QRZ5_9GAMM|nr:hypothetical protein PN36_20740 [Candidatus Thiomargarita nelsonii]
MLNIDGIIRKKNAMTEEWWNQLDDDWKKVFKKAINIESEPSNDELVKIVNLQKLSGLTR